MTTASAEPEKSRESGSEEENTSTISQEDLDFFQNCLVDDLLVVKEKLQETLKARIKYCTAEVNVLQAFPIFVFDSSLVIYFLQLTKSSYLIH